MRVSYVVSMFPCWSETFILNELVCLKNKGLDLNVFSLKECNEKLFHEEASQFVESTVYPLGIFNPFLYLLHLQLIVTNPLTCLTILVSLIKHIRKPGILCKSLMVCLFSPYFVFKARKAGSEHLHAHFATYPALLAWVISGFTGIPFSFTAHAHDIYVDASILKIIYRDADSIVAISDFNKRFIAEVVDDERVEKVRVIHCGIDVDRFDYTPKSTGYGGDQGPLRLLSIGRLSGIKGFSYLIAALGRLRDLGVNFTCDIIGDGPLGEVLKASVRTLGLDVQVVFHGAKNGDEIRRFLRESDLFVLACARDKKEGHDGIPVVFMEAMAMGTCVVGTRLSGIPELVRHRITGYCAEPEDPESLANCLREAIEMLHTGASIRKTARALVEKEFNIAVNCNKLSSLFQKSIGDR
jgi:glycosyltransferase involved in cell wall biosynthesis